MDGNDLRKQLSGLFSDVVPEPEVEETDRSLLDESVIFGLLGDEFVTAPAAAEQVVAEPPLSVLAEAEEGGGEREIPRTSIPSWKVALGKRSVSVLSILLYGAIILGGVPLLFLLIRFVGQGSLAWSGFSLYLAFYTLTVVVMLVQWLFNSFLTKALQGVEGQRDEAIRSRTPLEDRVKTLAAANASLQKRAFQLQISAQVARAAISILDQDRLMQETVNLICDRFDLYHVGLFLIDESREWAVLRAGTGEAGDQMLAQGHRFETNSDSLVGQCVAGARARIALDATAAQAWLLYEDDSAGPGEGYARPGDGVGTVEIISLLPRTRSEMVLPLLSGGRVIGALDIHSVEREVFSEEDIPVFQMMADQVAAAIDNARTFADIRARLEELEQSRMREQRARLAPARVTPLYERTQPGVKPLGDVVLPDVERALARRETVAQSGASDDGKISTLVVPVTLRDQVIGALGLQETESGRQWTGDEIALIEAVADQMALAIENARLLEETQLRAQRERIIGDITSRVRASMDMESVLRTAVRELGIALGTDRAFIQLSPGAQLSEE